MKRDSSLTCSPTGPLAEEEAIVMPTVDTSTSTPNQRRKGPHGQSGGHPTETQQALALPHLKEYAL